ncbi:Endonuclease/exonuclease/phosphatase [Polychytrium aggregatum]|uniref:Endonuclease/exonuclease/phosphatase n=1 Tax=Polychytrium aggregatum TaxID=110093 RepID=UPI0022FE7AB9|nr:Endonuclease/exonuclease/phosphatase [Polychytrium aggregatum]KAI9203810.1 Endonuclease/exonuclease/phosphatase [Polychytrium aggregatum]
MDSFLSTRDGTDGFDLIVVGVQECQRAIDASSAQDAWDKKLLEYILSDHCLVKSESLGGIHIAVFARHEHIALISSVGNVFGNKGAASISFTFAGSSFLFVNSHLTVAHQEKTVERNQDYLRILENHPPLQKFSLVVWFGDLNYRVEGTRAVANKLLADGALEVLLNNDQLQTEMKKGNCFHGFIEAPIHFLPTYKLDVYCPGSTGGDSTNWMCL